MNALSNALYFRHKRAERQLSAAYLEWSSYCIRPQKRPACVAANQAPAHVTTIHQQRETVFQ